MGKIKNSVLGRMEGKQGLLPRGGKYWNWILGDQESPSRITAGEKVPLAERRLG